MNEMPPSKDESEDVDDHYRRASALDPSRPSEPVRRAVLEHAARLAEEVPRWRVVACLAAGAAAGVWVAGVWAAGLAAARGTAAMPAEARHASTRPVIMPPVITPRSRCDISSPQLRAFQDAAVPARTPQRQPGSLRSRPDRESVVFALINVW